MTLFVFVLYMYNIIRFVVSRQTVLAAEWAPPAGEKWVEKDFTAELQKLEKEAEERLESKIAEMMGNIEKTGTK